MLACLELRRGTSKDFHEFRLIVGSDFHPNENTFKAVLMQLRRSRTVTMLQQTALGKCPLCCALKSAIHRAVTDAERDQCWFASAGTSICLIAKILEVF